MSIKEIFINFGFVGSLTTSSNFSSSSGSTFFVLSIYLFFYLVNILLLDSFPETFVPFFSVFDIFLFSYFILNNKIY